MPSVASQIPVSGKSDPIAERCRAALRDEALLRKALKDADIVPQLLVQAQLSGDTALLEEAAPHITGAWSYQESIPEELRARIRDGLVAALARVAAEGKAPALTREAFAQLVSGGAGKPVPDDYVAMMMEEMTEGTTDARSIAWRRPLPKEQRDRLKVIVIGAGLSGICMGIKLKEAGIPFMIYEKNSEVGGTWFENTYPGCAVDIPNHFYSFSFDLKNDWSRHFARHDELWDYLNRCVDKYGIREFIRFSSSVEAARYNAETATWAIDVKKADGASERIEANLLISGVGQLNRPAYPKIPGLETFKGPVIHTAVWDHTVDLKGKRVALVGTGASSMQVGPAVAADVEKLLVFQRTPNWANPNPNYHRTVPPGMIWALQNIPYLARWHRTLLSWASGDGFHAMLQRDPDWDQPKLSLNAENHAFRERLVAHITSQVGDRPDLMAKVVPDYPPYGKRMLRDNNWYQMLRRDNVELIDSGVVEVKDGKLVDRHGVTHEADVIVLATGFQTTQMLAPMDITGLGGRTIRDAWGDEDPRAYLGISVPGFPNFFVLFGPNTALSHGGSLFFHAECQVRYVMQCIRELLETGNAAMDVRTATFDDYNRRVDDAHERMVWTHPGMTSWYKNSKGRVVTNSPWRLVDYWKLTYALNPSDYVFAQAEPAARGE